MVTGADAMVNGIGDWCWSQAMLTGSLVDDGLAFGFLVDDGLDFWITGSLVNDAHYALLVLCLCQIL